MRVVLVNPQEPGNIGSAARVMKNFGLSELYLVKPQRKLTDAAYYMATHAKDVVENAVFVETTAEALVDCKFVLGTTARTRTNRAFEVYTPRQAAQTIPREATALMFGPEAAGLSNDDLDLCHAYVRIPTSEFASLNLAQAVNLITYEFFVTELDEDNALRTEDLATRDELEQLFENFLETAHLIGYTRDDIEGKTQHMYRRIFDRARLSERELNALHGLWRQTRWAALQNPEKLPGARVPNNAE